VTLRPTKKEPIAHDKIYKYTTLNPYDRRYSMYLHGEESDPVGHHIRITKRVSVIDLPPTKTQYRPRCTCGWTDDWTGKEIDAIKNWQIKHLYDFCRRSPQLPFGDVL
jgi:hypothetical protein